jgi:hypothetical protein
MMKATRAHPTVLKTLSRRYLMISSLSSLSKGADCDEFPAQKRYQRTAAVPALWPTPAATVTGLPLSGQFFTSD